MLPGLATAAIATYVPSSRQRPIASPGLVALGNQVGSRGTRLNAVNFGSIRMDVVIKALNHLSILYYKFLNLI